MAKILDTARHVLASHAFGEVSTTWHAAADCIAIGARAAPDLARFVVDLNIALTDPCDAHGASNCEAVGCLVVVATHLRRRLGLVSP